LVLIKHIMQFQVTLAEFAHPIYHDKREILTFQS
jgi:hypothetical protein